MQRGMMIAFDSQNRPIRGFVTIQMTEGTMSQHKWILIATESNKLANPFAWGSLAWFL
jgi:hypothetical protein